MNNSARISKPAVAEILNKYLDKELAEKMYFEMVEQDAKDKENVIGMTIREFVDRFDEDAQIVWADDTLAGFGKRGDPVYGNVYDCVICCVEFEKRKLKLWVWAEALTTDKAFINAAMEIHEKRQGTRA